MKIFFVLFLLIGFCSGEEFADTDTIIVTLHLKDSQPGVGDFKTHTFMCEYNMFGVVEGSIVFDIPGGDSYVVYIYDFKNISRYMVSPVDLYMKQFFRSGFGRIKNP